MSVVQIKGVNDYLLFILNDEVQEDDVFETLKALITSSSFQKKGFYPKAYFDIGKREVTNEFFLKLMSLLETSRSVIFCGFHHHANKDKTLFHLKTTIRNGQVEIEKEDCLFEGKINPGGKLIVYGNLYLLGLCQGEIELIGEKVSCSASKMDNASLQINGIRKEGISIDYICMFYEEDGEIKSKREEVMYG